MNVRTPILVPVILSLVVGCAAPKKHQPKLDRQLIGAELEFGRQAAKSELWNEAIFRWEKVVVAQPENPDAKNNLAVAYESVGNYEKAKDLYRDALQLNEDSQVIRRNYKRFLNFYKRHQRQLARDRQKAESEEAPAESPEDQGGSMP